MRRLASNLAACFFVGAHAILLHAPPDETRNASVNASLTASLNASLLSPPTNEPPPPKELPVPIAWLHTPKCGTSFANVLYHHSGLCPKMPAEAVMRPGDQWSTFIKKHSVRGNCPGTFSHPFTGDHFGIGWDWERIGGNHVFAFFRQPEQRMISGWLDKSHDWPTPWKPMHIMEYAEKMRGCAARMLLFANMPCGMPLAEPNALGMKVAVGRVKELAFVGLTEQWELSVCLFHAMYGGNCTDTDFVNMRPGKLRTAENRTEGYNVAEYLGTWRDPFDGPIYEEASRVFWQRVEEYQVNRTRCARLCKAAKLTRPFAPKRAPRSSNKSKNWRRKKEETIGFSRISSFAEARAEEDWPGRASYDQD